MSTPAADLDSAPAPAATARRFPAALTVLAGILVVLWLVAFFVPAGVYDLDPDSGAPIPGSYRELPDCGDAPDGELCSDDSLGARFGQLWRATPNGLYGIENADTRLVGADESGGLYGSAQIFLFVLSVGAFITMTMTTGAIEAGIARLALRFRQRPMLLVIVLMTALSIGGTTYGMWEETLGFYALMVPLAVALGYDRMVAVGIIALGAGTGVLASTVNPFATGVASDAAGVGVGDGIGLRVVMWLVLVPSAIAYVLWYGRRVRADPSRSLVGGHAADPYGAGDGAGAATSPMPTDVPELTRRHQLVLALFGLTFVVMIYGFVPWGDVWTNLFDADFPLPTFASFYFTEASMLFIVAAVVIGLVGRMGEARMVATLVSGASDFLGAGLVIVVARAITVVMKNAYITDTILHQMETVVDSLSGSPFAVLAWIVNIPLAFLVPSSSGHAALVMPILGPLADFADVRRTIAIDAYQSASGWVNLITPTSAVLMGGLTLARVEFNRYARFVGPYLVYVFVVVSVFMAVGAQL